ncbi:MAG TPA: hypothetical protein VFH48_23375 [Chloroflexota bacterium]|nr:hypothetical protein [Chloroflexota bacterium]
MSLNVSEIYRTITTLEAEAARLRRVAAEAATVADLMSVGLTLPSEVVVACPGIIVEYLRAHPDLVPLVGEMATALVDEFRGEHSQIELVLYQDPEIDDRQLTFYVRLPLYNATLIPRLHAVSERVDSLFPPTPDWVLVTTDYRPIQ